MTEQAERRAQVHRDIAGFRESIAELEILFTAMFAATHKAVGDGHKHADLVDRTQLVMAEQDAASLFFHLRRIFKTT